jgi:hypothetical protein
MRFDRGGERGGYFHQYFWQHRDLTRALSAAIEER